MLAAHVGTKHIVRPNNGHAIEAGAAEVDRQQLAGQFAAAVGVARIEHIGHHERHRLGRGHERRRLIGLGTREHDQVAHAVLSARVEHVEHATHGDFEHQFRALVEVPGAVDGRQVAHRVDAAHSPGDGRRIADVASYEFEVVCNVGQPLNGAARVVVEGTHAVAGGQKRAHHGAADEACAAGDENPLGVHAASRRLAGW